MQPQTARPEGALTGRDATVAPRAPAQHRKREARPTPVLDAAYAHLTLEALRGYRQALTDEADKVSYWRRILQARLDVVVSGATRPGRGVEHDRLASVLTSERVGTGRRALVRVAQDDDIPPLPRLAELWERHVDADDEPGRAAFAADLRAAELQLSAYRSALHSRIGEATGELIARYREAPALCLSALPVRPDRPAGVS